MSRNLKLARLASLLVVFVMLVAPTSTVWAQDPTPTPEVLPTPQLYANVGMSERPKLGTEATITISGFGFPVGRMDINLTVTDLTGNTITTIPISTIVIDSILSAETTWVVPLDLWNRNVAQVKMKATDAAGNSLNPEDEVFDIDFEPVSMDVAVKSEGLKPGETATIELYVGPMQVVNRLTVKFLKPDDTEVGNTQVDVPVSRYFSFIQTNWTVPSDYLEKDITLVVIDELGRKLYQVYFDVQAPDLSGENPSATVSVNPNRVQNGQPVSFNLTGTYFKPNAEVFIMVQEDQGVDREWVSLGIADGSGSINASVTWTPQAFHPGKYRLFVTWKDQQGQTDVVPVQAGDHEISITLSEQALALQLGVADAFKNDPDLINQIAAAVRIPEGTYVTQEELKVAIQAALNEVQATYPTPVPESTLSLPYSPATDPGFNKAVNDALDAGLLDEVAKQIQEIRRDLFWIGILALVSITISTIMWVMLRRRNK